MFYFEHFPGEFRWKPIKPFRQLETRRRTVYKYSVQPDSDWNLIRKCILKIKFLLKTWRKILFKCFKIFRLIFLVLVCWTFMENEKWKFEWWNFRQSFNFLPLDSSGIRRLSLKYQSIDLTGGLASTEQSIITMLPWIAYFWSPTISKDNFGLSESLKVSRLIYIVKMKN